MIRLCALFLLLTLAACNRNEQAPPATTPVPATAKNNDCKVLRARAEKLDSTLLTHIETDSAAAREAIRAFADFAIYCGQDSVSAIYLIKMAQVARAINNLPQAKLALERCINDYPDFRGRPAAMFLLAQLYDEDNFMNNEAEAQTIYRDIIANYPRSVWADNARAALQLIGKTDAEIMRQLKKGKNR